MLVPLGASLPASLVDPGEGATQAQINVLDRMADDFVRQVQAPETEESAAPATKPNTARPADQQPANWSAAAQAADERYRQLFGVEAYNAWSAAASKEGLQEKKNAAGR